MVWMKRHLKDSSPHSVTSPVPKRPQHWPFTMRLHLTASGGESLAPGLLHEGYLGRLSKTSATSGPTSHRGIPCRAAKPTLAHHFQALERPSPSPMALWPHPAQLSPVNPGHHCYDLILVWQSTILNTGQDPTPENRSTSSSSQRMSNTPEPSLSFSVKVTNEVYRVSVLWLSAYGLFSFTWKLRFPWNRWDQSYEVFLCSLGLEVTAEVKYILHLNKCWLCV